MDRPRSKLLAVRIPTGLKTALDVHTRKLQERVPFVAVSRSDAVRGLFTKVLDEGLGDGEPASATPGANLHLLSVRLPADLLEKLETRVSGIVARCDDDHVSRADVLRWLLACALDGAM